MFQVILVKQPRQARRDADNSSCTFFQYLNEEIPRKHIKSSRNLMNGIAYPRRVMGSVRRLLLIDLIADLKFDSYEIDIQVR